MAIFLSSARTSRTKWTAQDVDDRTVQDLAGPGFGRSYGRTVQNLAHRMAQNLAVQDLARRMAKNLAGPKRGRSDGTRFFPHFFVGGAALRTHVCAAVVMAAVQPHSSAKALHARRRTGSGAGSLRGLWVQYGVVHSYQSALSHMSDEAELGPGNSSQPQVSRQE